MGLDEFTGSGSDDSSSGSSSSSSNSSSSSGLGAFTGSSSRGGGGGHTGISNRWNTRIDFGTPYILVAEDREGTIYKHRDTLAVLDDNLDWRRLDEHPDKEFQVIYSVTDKEHWLRFCNRAQEQLGVDPEELLENDPRELSHTREKVYYPPGSKPDKSRSCRVCGANSEEDGLAMMELDLQSSRRVPVCSTHTVEDLAHEGLLD